MSGNERTTQTWAQKLFLSTLYAGAIAILFPGACALIMHVTTFWSGIYGYTLFLGVPFSVGLGSSLLCRSQGMWKCVLHSIVLGTVVLAGTAGMLLAFASEGVICVLMAAPLALPVTAAGAIAGSFVFPRISGGDGKFLSHLVVVLLTPVMFGAEWVIDLTPPVYPVVTTRIIDATPDVVWENVVSFPELKKPTELLFRVGIAYPVCATIDGAGPGAIRRCIFDTGEFIEPIEIWDEPHLLRFGVTENPPPMREWSPYGEIHPEHLDGFLVAKRGQFKLEALPDGRTQLEGTTWYSHGLWPAWYWHNWSDYIIHRIHGRVLDHIKQLAESDRR
jgi:hypothetical protein